MSVRKTDIKYKEGDSINPTNLSRSWVEDFASRVASTLEFDVGNDPGELVKRIGGRIHYQHIDDWLEPSGSLFVHGRADFDILLPQYTSPVRDRFTVAHELGHYFLHADQGATPIVAYRSGSTRIEWEANWFAAGLLMPKNEFKKILARMGEDLFSIARHFGVSQEAAKVRRDVLGH
jgi:hypothetical protein